MKEASLEMLRFFPHARFASPNTPNSSFQILAIVQVMARICTWIRVVWLAFGARRKNSQPLTRVARVADMWGPIGMFRVNRHSGVGRCVGLSTRSLVVQGRPADQAAVRVRLGAPLCRAWSQDLRRDGLEIVLKGGQMGAKNFFGLARDGSTARSGAQSTITA